MVSAIYRKDAFELADKHCQQYGRMARVSGTRTVQNGAATEQLVTFDCIKLKD